MTTDTAENTPTPSSPAPYSKFPPVKRTCAECSVAFETKSRTKLFCSPAHKLIFHNRNAARGKVLAPLAMAWRGRRGGDDVAKRAFQQMNKRLDEWNAEDREAGRMSMAEFVERGFARWHRR